MNYSKKYTAIIYLIILVSCNKYDLARTNLHDPKSKYFVPDLPEILTDMPTDITEMSAKTSATIISDGGGDITARGVCWGTSTTPDISGYHTLDGSGKGTFTALIEGLTSNSFYYARAYATNITGTAYGNLVSFTTYGVVDANGNGYKTIVAGNQEWMAENLKTTRYNDATTIPYITDINEWTGAVSGAYCWYFNDEINYKNTYGALYNWKAVNTGKLCPKGWHVPSDEEWHTFILSLDPNAQLIFGSESNIAGGKLKATGTLEEGTGLWSSPNTGATNEIGFNAIPGGFRDAEGVFQQVQLEGYAVYWSSTEVVQGNSFYRMLGYTFADAYRGSGWGQNGNTVRCVR
jgi:uncharacterized protein (TIGR02145 family)